MNTYNGSKNMQVGTRRIACYKDFIERRVACKRPSEVGNFLEERGASFGGWEEGQGPKEIHYICL